MLCPASKQVVFQSLVSRSVGGHRHGQGQTGQKVHQNQPEFHSGTSGRHAPKDSEHCALLAANTFHKALRDYAIGKKK